MASKSELLQKYEAVRSSIIKNTDAISQLLTQTRAMNELHSELLRQGVPEKDLEPLHNQLEQITDSLDVLISTTGAMVNDFRAFSDEVFK